MKPTFEEIIKKVNSQKTAGVSPAVEVKSSAKPTFEQIVQNVNEKKSNKKSFESIVNSIAAKRVDENYYNSFLKDAESFFQNAVSDYDKMQFGNYQEPYKATTQKYNDLKTRSSNIKSWLEHNKSGINSKTYDNISSWLSEFETSSKSVYDAFSDKNNLYSQFKTEDEYNAAVELNKQLSFDTEAERERLLKLDEKHAAAEGLWNEFMTAQEKAIEAHKGDSSFDSRAFFQEWRPKFAQFYLDYEGDVYGKGDEFDLDEYYDFSHYVNHLNDEYNSGLENVTALERFQKEYADRENIEKVKGYSDFETKKEEGATLRIALLGKLRKENSGYTLEFYENFLGNESDARDVFDYYLATQGEDAALKYAHSLSSDVREQSIAARDFEAYEGNTLKELFYQFSSGAGDTIDAWGKFFTGNYDKDEFNEPTADDYLSGAINEDLHSGKITGILGDLSYTIGGMAPSIAVSLIPGVGQYLGPASFGISAGSQAYETALQKGLTDSQALTYAVLVGSSEVFLEKFLGGISSLGGKYTGEAADALIGKLDNVFSRVTFKGSGLIHALTGIAVRGGTAAFGEFTEESLQTILEPWFESVVTGNNFNAPEWEEIAYNGLLGALSGGLIESIKGTYAATSTASKYSTFKKDGKAILEVENSVEKLKSLGRTYSEGAALRLANILESNPTAYDAGVALHQLGVELSAQNESDIYNRLVSDGVSEHDAGLMTDGILRVSKGDKLKSKQKIALSENEHLNRVCQRVLQDVVLNPESSLNKRKSDFDSIWEEMQRNKSKKVSKSANAPSLNVDDTSSSEQSEAAAPTEEAPAVDIAEQVEEDISSEYLLKSTGEAVEVAKIVNITDGSVTVELKDGSTMNANEISFPSDVGLLYENMDGMNSVVAEGMVKNFNDSGLDALTYVTAFKDAVKFGQYGVPFVQLSSSKYASKLPPMVRSIAYKYGSVMADYDAKKKTEAKTEEERIAEGEVIFVDSSIKVEPKKADVVFVDRDGNKTSLNEDENKSFGSEVKDSGVAVARIISKVLNMNVIVYESYIDSNGERVFYNPITKKTEKNAPNGIFQSSTGDIHLDINAGTNGEGLVAYAFAHELTHYIRRFSPKSFKAFADVILEAFATQGKNVDNLIHEKIEALMETGELSTSDTYEKCYDTAYEEIVADACQTMLTETDAIVKVSQKLKYKEKTIWEKVKDAFLQAVERIKAIYKSIAPESEEAKMLLKTEKLFAKAGNLWTKGLIDAGTNAALVEGVANESNNLKSSRNRQQQETANEVKTVISEQNVNLREDMKNLKELLKLQGNLTYGLRFTKTSVDAYAGLLRKKFSTRGGDKAKLSSMLNAFYESIASGDDSWATIEAAAKPIVEMIYSDRNVKLELEEDAQRFLSDIRKRRISLEEAQKQEVANAFGSYNDYRKKTMGSFIISETSSVPLTSMWAELVELYPGMFDANANPAEMPLLLMDAVNKARERYIVDEYSLSEDLVKADIFRAVYDGYWYVSTLQTVAELDAKSRKKLAELKEKHRERMNKVASVYEEKIKLLRDKHRSRLEKIQLRYDSKIKEMSAGYEATQKKRIEERSKTELRRKIKRLDSDLRGKLLRPTKEKHIPQELRIAVANVLDTANMDTMDANARIHGWTDSQGVFHEGHEQRISNALNDIAGLKIKLDSETDEVKRQELENEISKKEKKHQDLIAKRDSIMSKGVSLTKRLKELHQAYEEIRTTESADELYDDFLSDKIKSVAEKVKNVPVRNMSLEQLQALYELLKSMHYIVSKENNRFMEERGEDFERMHGKVAREILANAGKERRHLPQKLEDSKSVFWAMLQPRTFFKHIGSETLSDLFEDVRKGEETNARVIFEASEFHREMKKKYGYRSWKKGKIEFEDLRGEKIELSLQQRMTLYALSRRQQARKHLLQDGFTVDGPRTKVIDGKKIKVDSKYSFVVSEETLDRICESLTEDQRGYVESLQAYMSTVLAEKGNEVSMVLYGIKLFNEQNYVPIKVDGDVSGIAKAEDNQGLPKIKNKGMAMPTNQDPAGAIKLGDFTTLFGDHAEEMAEYHAYVVPLERFTKIYNYKDYTVHGGTPTTLRGMIESSYGRGAVEYIDKLVQDINGGFRTDPNFLKKIIALVKKNRVAFSLSVGFRQVSSVIRSMAYIAPHHFVSPNKWIKNHSKQWETLKKYAPIALVKEMGYFDLGAGKNGAEIVIGDKGVSDWIDDAAFWLPTKMDEFAWLSIWNAVVRETRHKYDAGKMSETDFLKQYGDVCGNRFTEIIVASQVYDSVFSRSGMMRNKNLSEITAFMGEPTKQLNMIWDTVLNVQKNIKNGRVSGAVKVAGRMGATLASAIVVDCALASIVYAGRDDDEDKSYWEKYVSSFKEQFDESTGIDGFLSLIPFARDLVSLYEGYSVERMDVEAFSGLMNAVKAFQKEGKSTAEKFEALAFSLSELFGVPFSNVKRDIKATWNILNAPFYEAPIREENSDEDRKRELIKTVQGGNSSEIRRYVGKVIADQVEAGEDKTSVRANLKRTLTLHYKPLYIQGDAEERTKIRSALFATGLYDNASELIKTVNSWLKNDRKEDGK